LGWRVLDCGTSLSLITHKGQLMIKSHKHDIINDDILNRLDEIVASDADIDAAGDVTDAKDSSLSDDDILDRLDEIVASDADIDAAGDVTR
jgi:hypothetical protein